MKPALPTAPWKLADLGELADFATAKRPAPHIDCFDHRGATATVLARIDGGRPVLIDRHREAVTDPTARRKIWDLDGSLHCSVIGTCLTIGELRTLIGKFHASLADKPTEHTLHTVAVAAAAQHNLIAKQIQKALDRRHAATIRHFGDAKTVDDLRRRWAEARQAGEIPGAYWAMLTHPKTNEALVREVFGDVHMLSHLVGAANRADIRKLHQLEEEKAALEEKLVRQQTQLRDGIVARDAKIRELNTALSARIEQQNRAVPVEAAASDATVLDGVVADLRKLLDRETKRREKAEKRADELTRAQHKSERAKAAVDEELASLRADLAAVEAQFGSAPDDDDAASMLDLNGTTLLYVGGRPHQVAKLRGLVEEGSGVLIHHDGGIEERPDLLPGLVSRADAAFFPVDCISHRAALLLKRLCQQAGKPYVPLRSTGVASMLRALRSTNIGIAAPRSAAE